MSDAILTLAVAILSSSALSSVIGFFLSRRAEKDKSKNGLYIATRQTYYRRIKHDCQKYLERGYIHADELEDLIEDHRIYHDVLGGNGYLDKLMEEVKALPIK